MLKQKFCQQYAFYYTEKVIYKKLGIFLFLITTILQSFIYAHKKLLPLTVNCKG